MSFPRKKRQSDSTTSSQKGTTKMKKKKTLSLKTFKSQSISQAEARMQKRLNKRFIRSWNNKRKVLK